MKPPKLSYDQLLTLDAALQVVVPPEYEDENGHMNFRRYFDLFNDGAFNAFAAFGFASDFPQRHGIGVFDLEYHVHFVSEVLVGETVSVRLRLVGMSEKRLHYLVLIVNDTRQTLAAMFECVSTFVDLNGRRSTPMPAEVRERAAAQLAQHQALDWDAPSCGVMSA